VSQFRLIVICILSLAVAACSGGGGGGGGGKTITGTSSSYSSDGATKTITTTYSDGTSSQQTLTGAPSDPAYSGSQLSYKYSFSDGSKSPTQTLDISTKTSESFSSDGITKTVTYTLGGGKQVSFTLTGTAGTATYKDDGSEKYIPYSYMDSTTHTATLTGTLTSPKYSANFLQKTLVYSFNDGPTHDGSTINGHADTPQFSADGSQKTPVYRYDDGTQYFGATLNGTLTTPLYSSDGSQKTLRYSFTDGTTHDGTTLNGTKTNPLSDAAVYPSNWTTTGTVTKPVTHALFYSFPDQTTYTVEDGTSAKPFSQSNLTPNGAEATGAINDPNAYVNAPTKGTYNLQWGTPDPAGPGYSSLFGNGSSNYTFQSTFTIFGRTVAGTAGCSNTPCSIATLGTPHPDVIQAWNAGWTGKGVNILIDDDITNSHSVTTSLITHRYAWGSTIYGTSFNDYSAVQNWDGTTPNLNSTIKIGVINASFGANLQYLTQKSSGWTSQDFQTAYTGYGSSATVHKDVFNGNKTNSNFASFNLTDAVITKAAGNDSIDAYNEPLNRYLVEDPTISTRLLIVGALAQDPGGGKPLFAEGYSNTAGASAAIKARFLVALGTTPFQTNWVSWNGTIISGSDNGNNGTSYAAPRVAGYVAIVRQKFPNLTAPNTADIMLATARYDTLGCYTPGNGPTGGCDTSKYGQGEASLSRALAPVGYLR